MSGRWYRRVFGSDSQAPWKWQELADYNSRLHKGIVHEPYYAERMRLQQAGFDAEMRAKYATDPNVILLRGNE